MKNTFRLLITLTMGLLLYNITNAQVYKFRQYNYEKDGLCHNFIYSISQDTHGFLWFATGLGLCRYDGFQFVTPEEELPLSNVTTSFCDKAGNLWFGYNDGLVIEYDGTNFFVADTSQSNTSINQIIQAPGGEMLIVTQTDGITRLVNEKIEYLPEGFEDKLLYSACFIDGTRLLIGCQDGLYIYNYQSDLQSLSFIARIDPLEDLSVKSIIPQKKGNGFWVATQDNGIFYAVPEQDNLDVKKVNIPELDDVQIQSVYEDSSGDLWISTFGKGLFRIRLSAGGDVEKIFNYNNSNGLGSDYIKEVFFDSQQNLWVATYGQGAACLTNLAVSFFETIDEINNNATAIFSNDDSEYWIGGMGAVVKIASVPYKTTTVLGRANGIPNERITALHMDEEGNTWIGTEKSGLYKLPKNSSYAFSFFRSENSLSNTMQAITSFDGELWLATRNGVLIIDMLSGKINDHLNTDSGLPHNNIRDIYKDSDNTIWIATSSNSLLALNEEERLILENEGEVEFTTLTEDGGGNFWAGTNGRGVYFFDRKNDTTYHFTVQDGLKADFCYAITYDGDSHVWVGHRLGLSRINIHKHAISAFGLEYGLTGDVNNNAMLLNKSGEMLVGTTEGLMVYQVDADDTQEQAPILNLTGVTIGDRVYDPSKPITLPYNRYKVQFDFIGLQYANPASVTYQYFLQGYYDTEWSSPSGFNSAIYPRLEDGEYTFWLRACNSDNCTEEARLFVIKIRKPFWKTWWFVVLSIIIVVGSIYLIITVRERNHRIQQEYLERELAERTKEVREQKEEIEAKNRDITDSINYAQRIQFSVLPSTRTLLDHCSEAFIFYRPRDIVSGDFYWFEYFPETERLIIVCADSTGHGVPGAFMSLIGTTLIKDIAMRPDVLNPSDILYRLDENIQSTLNQNQESEQANDGMDLVVCEINTRTHMVRVASAMRPYIIYHKGTPTTYKCSRASIGGGQSVRNKVFETTEIQLSVGDTIYMFTDGYADQFGGPAGKKFKMNRLQSIFTDVHTRNMDEQCRVIKENFDLWKGTLDQVDDVLIIGVRI